MKSDDPFSRAKLSNQLLIAGTKKDQLTSQLKKS